VAEFPSGIHACGSGRDARLRASGGGRSGAAFGGSESAESIPGFLRRLGASASRFEPLSSGPTALVNRSRRPNGTGDILKLAGDYTNPILTPEAVGVVKSHGELGLNGIGDPNPRNQCWPAGVPFVFRMAQRSCCNSRQGHHPLWLRSSSPPRALEPTSSGAGDPVLVRRFSGALRRRPLVIDTVGIKVGRYSMVDWYGTPHTEALHVVDDIDCLSRSRQRRVCTGRKGAQRPQGMRNPTIGQIPAAPITVEDKAVFTTPWTATMTYGSGGRDPAGLARQACAENHQGTGKGRERAAGGQPDSKRMSEAIVYRPSETED